MVLKIDKSKVEALAIGGLILGGGGGGDMSYGVDSAKVALADNQAPEMIRVEDLPEGAVVLTISAVGAPSATEQYVDATNYVEIVELFEKNFDLKVNAVITNEMGGGSSFNAFIPSSLKGIPMLDASCNGRAHPLGTMGAMGLAEQEGYVTQQSAVGGNPTNHKKVQIVAEGSVNSTSTLVRQAAVEAGGVVVVARNPVSKEFILKNAALGTITQSYEVGSTFLSGKTPEEKVQNVAKYLGGSIICRGKIDELTLTMVGGLDEGILTIYEAGNRFDLFIWNEYMALDKNGKRQNTFPDLIMTFDEKTGMPVTSSALVKGQGVFVLQVPYQQLSLGAGMYEESGYHRIEAALGIEMIPYIKELIQKK